MLLATMLAHAADLDHRALRREARALCGRIHTLCNRARCRLTHRAAMLADEEHHRRAVGVIVDAGEERVAALDAMHEPLRGEEIQRAVDRDRRRTRPPHRDLLDDLI